MADPRISAAESCVSSSDSVHCLSLPSPSLGSLHGASRLPVGLATPSLSAHLPVSLGPQLHHMGWCACCPSLYALRLPGSEVTGLDTALPVKAASWRQQPGHTEGRAHGTPDTHHPSQRAADPQGGPVGHCSTPPPPQGSRGAAFLHPEGGAGTGSGAAAQGRHHLPKAHKPAQTHLPERKASSATLPFCAASSELQEPVPGGLWLHPCPTHTFAPTAQSLDSGPC